MIKITLERDAWRGWDNRKTEAKTIVREFECIEDAENWFVHDSYFSEGYTRRAVWERVDE